MNTRDAIEERIRKFPSMPAFCVKIANQLHNPNADLKIVADVVQYDPGLTANILQLANSAYYGLPHSVSSLRDAIVRIGLKKIMQLILARGIADTLRQQLKGYDLQPAEMLQHSVWVAIASEEFCKATKAPIPETMFTAGLLHDLGKIVLDDFVMEHRAAIEAENQQSMISWADAEEKVLGMNHAEVGGTILARWRFPEELIEAARWHHAPAHVSHHPTLVNIVHLADTLAHVAGIGTGRETAVYAPAPSVLANLQLTRTLVEYVASQTLDKMTVLSSTILAK